MQIPVGKMFVKSIFTLTQGLIFVYVRLYNPPKAFWGLSCGQTSLGKIIVFKILHLYRTRWENCCRSSNFSDTSATSIQKYLFYKIACFFYVAQHSSK